MSKPSRFRQPVSSELAMPGNPEVSGSDQVLTHQQREKQSRGPRATTSTNPFLESTTTTNPFSESPLKPNPFDDPSDPSDDVTMAEIDGMSSREDNLNRINGQQKSPFDPQFQRIRKNCPEPSSKSDSSRKVEVTSHFNTSSNQLYDDVDSYTESSDKGEIDGNRNNASMSTLSFKDSAKYMNAADPVEENLIYNQNRMSEPWLYTALIVHIVQFVILITLGRPILSNAAMIVLVLLATSVAVLLLVSRKLVKKNRRRSVSTTLFRKRIEGSDQRTPEDEADFIPSSAIHCLSAAAVLEGCTFALYTVMLAGYDRGLDNHSDPRYGGKQRQIILETMRFASITLLTFHRILRPANRVDPMRTMLELEVVTVCWDALDGSTLYQLISEGQLPTDYDTAARVMMVFWYISVGFRMAFMMLSHLGPSSKLYRLILSPPLTLATQPTVDRTLQSLRLRSEVIIVMGAAEFFAASLRISLWINGYLRNNSLQQEMAIKNVLFLGSVYNAYSMWTTAKDRSWNSRELGFGFRYPSRQTQRQIYRWLFILTYLLQGALFSGVLVLQSAQSNKWTGNVITDLLLVLYFAIYCNNTHIQNMDSLKPCCFFPTRSYVVFPSKKVLVISVLMGINMYVGRVPALFYTYTSLARRDIMLEGWLSYDNVLLIVAMSVLPIAFAAMYWSLSYMLFRKEFTACPGNYNAIHDPTISMVATATMIEGSLDVLSCATLMQLAVLDLPASVNGAIVVFSLLELVNACQSFALQVLLSGGHDDTPLDLVKWKAYLRMARGLIDFGAFVLRIVLWVRYGSVSTVFLIKNLYNLLHTAAQIERWSGVWRYPKHTLFTEYVPAPDWYGMSKEEWRAATGNTLALQARAGRRI